MPPNNTHSTVLEDQFEDPTDENFLEVSGFVSRTPTEKEAKPVESKRQEIIWVNVILITLFHILTVFVLVAYIKYIKFMSIVWGKLIFD